MTNRFVPVEEEEALAYAAGRTIVRIDASAGLELHFTDGSAISFNHWHDWLCDHEWHIQSAPPKEAP